MRDYATKDYLRGTYTAWERLGFAVLLLVVSGLGASCAALIVRVLDHLRP